MKTLQFRRTITIILSAVLIASSFGVPAASAQVAVACSFTRSLYIGRTGADVLCLQRYLNSAGFAVATSGAGAPGLETTYFGTRTRAAVSRWQAANGVYPTAGYFGPISQARYAVLLAGGVNPNPNPWPTTTGIMVSGSGTMPTGSVIAGAGQSEVLRFSVTAGTGTAATITSMTFDKTGVISDSAITNAYLADEQGSVVGQFSSFNAGMLTFSNLNIPLSAGQTRTFTLRTDIASGASTGNTIGFRLTGITTTAGTPTGLPINGNSLFITTVTSPSLATASITFNSVSSSVPAGTTSALLSSASVSIGNSPVNLRNLTYTMIGSANPSDIRNLRLVVNGVTVATKLVADSSNRVSFDMNATPVRLQSGNSTIEVFADVLGGANRTIQLTLLRPYDAYMVDAVYNAGITPSLNTSNSTTVTISQGQATVSLASDTPTGNVPVGVSNVTLAKFNVFASSEPIRVKFLDVTLAKTGGSAWTSASNANLSIGNIRLVDSAGTQAGAALSTINSGTDSSQCTLTSADSITCHIGTSSSPMNYVIPANTSRTLSLMADIKSTADISTIRASLAGNTSNLEGQFSFQTNSSGSASGAVLTVISTPLSATVNSAFANPTYAAGASGVRIASFVVNASSAEGGRITSLTLDKDLATNALDLQNLRVMVNSVQFGSTYPIVSDGGSTVTFSGGSGIQVPSGQSTIIEVYADILSSSAAGSYAGVIDLNGWNAVGTSSNSSLVFSGAVEGQTITIGSGVTLSVSASSDTSPSQQVAMGSNDNILFRFRVNAGTSESIRLTDVTVTDSITSGGSVSSFQNLSLYENGAMVAGPVSLTLQSSTSGTVAFHLSTPVIISANGSKVFELRGSVASFTSGGSTSGSTHVFSIQNATDITAFGSSSNTAITLSGTPASGNAQSIVRTKLTLTGSTLGATSGRTRVAVDDIATLRFAVNGSTDATVSGVTLTFSGQAVASGTTAFSVSLIDENTNTTWGSSSATTCTPTAGNTCSVTFTPSAVVSGGTTKNVRLRINSSSIGNTAQTSDSLSVIVNTAGSVTWSDGTTSGLTLESTVVPLTIANISYE